MTDIGLFEAIYSAIALRRFKPDPVPEELITQVLDAAIRAPSAGNAQNWAFVVVRGVAQRSKLGTIYRKASDIRRRRIPSTHAPRASERGAVGADDVVRRLSQGPHGRGADATSSTRSRRSAPGCCGSARSGRSRASSSSSP